MTLLVSLVTLGAFAALFWFGLRLNFSPYLDVRINGLRDQLRSWHRFERHSDELRQRAELVLADYEVQAQNLTQRFAADVEAGTLTPEKKDAYFQELDGYRDQALAQVNALYAQEAPATQAR